ncbi:alpha/beta fold hydrolase [Bradyrhizobium sp. 182]|uniref:alpha/beta fold hydrolase n=1 Tax=unclassified Bradyrhizobium TaxID=2631580 RepID=UPI001FF7261B|nr:MULTISPECIES: alpha/beta fold hydrolase [unclassified Bradyrhizobium]MCK1423007.1 alpha/beta fold hydrolase [Bradyrhizobium sp. CW12]MCK1529374.1 alpha/beta fold hydrolase [Bradyrhizobium sp. 182]MCK1643774.1 alpha/beta fold hydrolase [Bradyrhizobium sp. 154]
MTSISVRDGVLDIAESGAGKPVVLLHSLLADRTIFDRIVPMLARARRVIVPDLPGFGGSSSAGATIEEIADRIAGLFDALNLGTGADVLGNGFGGFVASTLAIRHGGKFDRLVLADTGLTFSPDGKQSFYAMAERVRQAGMGAIIDVAMKRLFPEDFIAAHPEVVAQRRNALLKTNPEFFAEACLALAALDLTSGIVTIRNPTLVVVGELDAATPPEMARALARALPKAELIEIPSCGHAPMAQAPEAFIKTISGFLELN